MRPINFYFTLYSLFLTLLFTSALEAQEIAKDKFQLENDTLLLANQKITAKWLWNKGHLIPHTLTAKSSGKEVEFGDGSPSFVLVEHPFEKNISLTTEEVSKSYLRPAHLQLVVINQHTGLEVKQTFRLFEGSTTVSVTTDLKYTDLNFQKKEEGTDFTGAEDFRDKKEAQSNSLNYFALNSPHWYVETIEFKDVTDEMNTLVFNKAIIPYKHAIKTEGNLVIATLDIEDKGFFVLKEGPNTTSQVNYPGYDFDINLKKINTPFSGYPLTNGTNDWVEGYTLTIGLGTDRLSILKELRSYLHLTSMFSHKMHDMVMMNTWGDRGRDGKITEKFILNELKEAAKLGITHYQIDDGWQQGLSQNSASTDGNLWDAWTAEDWQPHAQRFPNGLDAVVKEAKRLNIRLGVWFHPSNNQSYANWEVDANIIKNLYEKTGIQYVKIDGIKIKDKKSEHNLQQFFEKVKKETNGAVFFNLDLTAGVRGGYFMYRNLGNLFLENRYTDWGNYYPYQTLRNLWMLSAYFPPELLQIEFLNNERSLEVYGDNNPLAPVHYPFDYLFGTTMAAQPLAWFEATGLSDKAKSIAPLIETYKTVQQDFHSGQIFPIGSEPSGTSVTGFQSIKGKEGYLIIYREMNDNAQSKIQTLLPSGAKVQFETVLGSTGLTNADPKLSENGMLSVTLPKPNSFIMLKYSY